MFILHFTVLLAFVTEVFCVNCTNKPDGLYYHDCGEYILCENHVAQLYRCILNTVFNSRTGQCDSPMNVQKPCGYLKDCSTIQDGSYADRSENCRTYYTCQAGINLGKIACTPGTVFNEEIQTCDWPSDVKRPCGTKP